MSKAINGENTDPSLLKHTVSAVNNSYPKILHLCHQGSMLEWSRIKDESSKTRKLRDNSTLSSFAVVKDQKRDRLISWRRLQNATGPEPPNPCLSCPESWSRLQVSTNDLKAFHFDIQDMFHQLSMPPRLHLLFPLHPVSLSDLSPTLQVVLLKRWPSLKQSEKVRPFQTTIPMGWNWAVVIANSVSARLLKVSFNTFRSSVKVGSLLHISDRY